MHVAGSKHTSFELITTAGDFSTMPMKMSASFECPLEAYDHGALNALVTGCQRPTVALLLEVRSGRSADVEAKEAQGSRVPKLLHSACGRVLGFQC